MNVRPLFAYVGGKTFLKEKLNEKILYVLNHKKITSYEEWFSGGLGSFFAVCGTLIDYKIKKIVLNDINTKLISLYSNISEGKGNQIIKEYMILENEFYNNIPSISINRHKTKEKDILKLELVEARDYYKKIVEKFNKSTDSFEQSVYLIFLQNHCFNGIYRENNSGNYNTPFNWEAKKITEEIISKKINDVFDCFKNFDITFKSCDFENLEINPNSLIYLDPPYLNNGIGENKYNKNTFVLNKQITLIEKIKDTDFIYSNHYDDRLVNLFEPNDLYSIDLVKRRNIISSSADSRGEQKIEVLISKSY